MTTTTLTLAAFLEARLAEDEELARAAASAYGVGDTVQSVWAVDPPEEADLDVTDYEIKAVGGWPVTTAARLSCNDADHIARHDPARVLAECAAKRRIVELHPLMDGTTYRGTPCCARCTANGEYPADDDYTDEQNWPCPTLRALASVYADHPDFREEWAQR
jgi:hypothetical protein